jgi:hypothetical protein
MTRLRDHPLMRHHGAQNWPPVWTQARREGKKTLQGEVGVLEYVHAMAEAPKCYLVIEHNNEHYVGALLFDDRQFASQVYGLLRNHCGRSIKEIGDLDMSHTL